MNNDEIVNNYVNRFFPRRHFLEGIQGKRQEARYRAKAI